MIEHQITPDVMDFTIARPPVRFRIDGDEFEAYPDLPAVRLLEFATRAQRLDTDDEDAVTALTQLFRLVLRPESADPFVHRLSDLDNPIGMQHIEKLIPWLMERYGMRPPGLPHHSSDGSPHPDDGTSSTVTALPAASTSGTYP